MSVNVNQAAAPARQSERLVILDSLRGIALLGILLINIAYFGLPYPSSDNLLLRRELGTVNQQVWYIVHWALDGTQRAIFSMLFGAGVILFISRLEKRTTGMVPAEYFIRRQLWLLVFGLFDAFVLLWPGDILFEYAVAGIIVFAFRKLNPKYLLWAAGISLLLMTARENREFFKQKGIISKGEAVALLDTTKARLTEVQKEQLGAMTGFKERSDSAGQNEEMEKNIRNLNGTYPVLYEHRSETSVQREIQLTYYDIWDILLFMFLGMAFFKTGVLTGNTPIKVYWWFFIVGSAAGLLLSYFRIQPLFQYRFNQYTYVKNMPLEFYELARTLRSLGVFGLIMLLYQSGWIKGLFSLMRPVGQMAFTNYLMQSLLCGLFFYGIGFGMYGKLQRYEVYFVVAGVWLLEIAWSHIWLRHFRFGPLEWLWRSLTYWKLQPMRREKEVVGPAAQPVL